MDINNNRLVVTILVLIIALVGIGWFLSSRGLLPGSSNNNPGSSTASTKGTDWQAVFLNNGQVYFGKLQNEGSQFMTLTMIYYLQVAALPSPEPATKNTPSPAAPQISLVKLGSELHGPVDRMRLNRDQVVFIEQMKSDSKVVKAIESYEKSGPVPTGTPTATTINPAATP